MPPDAVLFDLDGTLVDREPLMTEAVIRVTAELGIDLRSGTAESWVGSAWPDFHAGLGVQDQTGLDLTAFLERIQATAALLIDDGFPIRVLPGGADLVHRLRVRGVPVGVVTGSMRGEATDALAGLGVLDVLDLLLTAEDYRPGKPHPACYLLAAERLEVPPDRCVAIEDSMVGVASAVAAGMWTVGVEAANAEPGHAAHQRLDDAHVVVPTLELLTDELLEPWGSGR